jgi:hypothetical protein
MHKKEAGVKRSFDSGKRGQKAVQDKKGDIHK